MQQHPNVDECYDFNVLSMMIHPGIGYVSRYPALDGQQREVFLPWRENVDQNILPVAFGCKRRCCSLKVSLDLRVPH